MSYLRLLLALFMGTCVPAFGATIYVTSIRSSEVQVIINGAAVRTLRPGETTPEGVRLREIRGATATFEVGGRAIALGLGQSTVAETLLRANASGHFIVNAAINGIPVRGVIDTGATTVTLNMELARRIGLDWSASRRVVAQTANGPAAGWEVPLRSVQVGDIALANVPGLVIEGGTEKLPIVLIGMSFLRHVEMRRSGDTMSLTRPHLQ